MPAFAAPAPYHRTVIRLPKKMTGSIKYYFLTTIIILGFVWQGHSQLQINVSVLPDLNFSPILSQNTSRLSTNSNIGYGLQIGTNAILNKTERTKWQIGLSYRYRTIKF